MALLDEEIEATKAAILAAMSGTTVRPGRVMGPTGNVGHGVIRVRREDGVAMAAAPARAFAGHVRRPSDPMPRELLSDAATDELLARLIKRRPPG